MSALTLALRVAPDRDVDLSPLTPDQLSGLGRAEIAGLRLSCGRRVADLFDIEGDDARQLRICNSTDRLIRVGAQMRSGTLTVEGDCGAHAGCGLRGGRLIVTGSAGPYAGCGMKAGLVEIRGDAGDFAGAALTGDRQGMRGGILLIHGNAGERAGERMRRGLMLIGGNAGEYAAANMLAGTIFIAGRVGSMPGLGLRRGTLLLAQAPAQLPVTFQDSGEHQFSFLTLLQKQLQNDPVLFARFLPCSRPARRYCGDLAFGGTGEILVFA
jgi:formylmethanofuran dehydrogenase subunit C